MLRSVAARRLLAHIVSPGRTAAAPAFRGLSTLATPQPNQPHTSSERAQGEHPNPTPGASASSRATGEDGKSRPRRDGAGPRASGDYEEEQARVLRAALPYVVCLRPSSAIPNYTHLPYGSVFFGLLYDWIMLLFGRFCGQVRFGWSESAMIAGARDVGISPSIVGSFPRKEAALVEVKRTPFFSWILARY